MTKETPGRRGRRNLALGLLLLAGVVNYVDRVTLSVANPLIRADLHLSAGQMGLLLSAFLWAYALAQAPVGILVDRLGARPLLTGAMVAWSAAQGAMGLATNLVQLTGARLVLGLAEAPQFPVGARVVRGWFPKAERGLATGVFNSASTLGPAIAPPLITGLMLVLGWRGAFLATGAAGLVTAAVWWGFYRDRPQSDADDGASTSGSAVAWRRLLASRTLWAMALGNFGAGYVNWFYAAWLPAYLEIDRGLSIPKTGWAASVPYLFGVAGSLGGGWACDRLARRGLSPMASRKAPIVAGLAGAAAFTGLAAQAPGDLAAIACVSAAIFFSNLAGAAIWALAVAAAPPRAVATVGSVQNFGGLMGGALAPIVTGFSLEASHSFAQALAITAAAAILAAAVYLFGVAGPLATGEVLYDKAVAKSG